MFAPPPRLFAEMQRRWCYNLYVDRYWLYAITEVEAICRVDWLQVPEKQPHGCLKPHFPLSFYC